VVVEDRYVEDEEEVIRVLVNFWPLVAGEHVFDIERMEGKVLLQPATLLAARILNVYPAKPLRLDLFDSRC
jgi:hypothetical protein